jgi:hypothetical protein
MRCLHLQVNLRKVTPQQLFTLPRAAGHVLASAPDLARRSRRQL